MPCFTYRIDFNFNLHNIIIFQKVKVNILNLIVLVDLHSHY